MKISVVMVVKNEEKIIHESISHALLFASEVIVIDTGSSDETKNIIKNNFGINPIDFTPPLHDKFSIVEAKNFGIKLAKFDWIMVLDADEIVQPQSATYLKTLSNEQNGDAFFGNWINFDLDEAYWDYKLFLFKKSLDLEFLGKCHSVPQTWIRKNNKNALFLNDLTIIHKKDLTKKHRVEYSHQMENAIKETPNWYRYHWFMGYSLLNIDIDKAKSYLIEVAYSNSKIFPVEVLNANFCLTEIFLREGSSSQADAYLRKSVKFFKSVENDFEVKINPYQKWIKNLEEKLELLNFKNFELNFKMFAC